MAEDDVIENFDFHQLPGPNEVSGDFDVGLGRAGFTARVIVHQDDG